MLSSGLFISNLFCRYREQERQVVEKANTVDFTSMNIASFAVVHDVTYHNIGGSSYKPPNQVLEVGDKIFQVADLSAAKYHSCIRTWKFIRRMHRRGTYMVLQKQPSGVFYSVDLKEGFKDLQSERVMKISIIIKKPPQCNQELRIE